MVIKIGELIDTVEYNYPDFHLIMQCFLCTMEVGQLTLKEHTDARWLTKEELTTVDWLPADASLVGKVKELLQ